MPDEKYERIIGKPRLDRHKPLLRVQDVITETIQQKGLGMNTGTGQRGPGNTYVETDEE